MIRIYFFDAVREMLKFYKNFSENSIIDKEDESVMMSRLIDFIV